MRSSRWTSFIALPTLAFAISAPSINGYTLTWSEAFSGNAGILPNGSRWDIMSAIDVNNEVGKYQASSHNVQLSGGQTLQLTPRKSSSGSWTSGRIESVDSWAPNAGGRMIVQSSLRLGSNAAGNKQGIWPAFWMAGQSMRQGTSWPKCGELDIMEQVNGAMTGYGTAHCGSSSGGPCQETTGLKATTTIPDDSWHTWTIKLDITNADWKQQTIQWSRDGSVFNTLTGATIADQGTWSTLAHSPFYVILNVAVGGDWPGKPNSATSDGYGSGMEVQYVAVYHSK